MLAIDDLTVRFGDTTAVDAVCLAVPTGSVTAVLGPSGCGKSTLLRAVAGLEVPTRGTVRWDGRDLTAVPTHRRGFALMFQDGQLFPHLSVGANVAYPLRLRRTRRAAREQRVAELLALVGLPGYDDRAPHTLSGGERQRVALARALAVEPRLLLLDEPLSALDRALRERLAADLHDILRRAGTTALMVTHDQDEAFAVADRMALMRAGRLVQSGTLEEVWQRPVDAEAARFLGYATVLTGEPAARLLDVAGTAARSPGAARSAATGAVASAGTGGLALRRSALRIADAGPVRGTVRSARLGPEQTRLTVEVAGIGLLHAVAPLGVRVVVGETVDLRLDETRCAAVGPG